MTIFKVHRLLRKNWQGFKDFKLLFTQGSYAWFEWYRPISNIPNNILLLPNPWRKKIFLSNKRDIHALLKVSDTSWSEMMRFSFYELWIVTGEETTWSWSCSFVQTSEMKSYWVERWWKRRLNHQLVGYLWPTPAAVSLTLQEPKVCQKNVPPHWKILFKRKFFKNFFVHNNSVRHFLLIPN